MTLVEINAFSHQRASLLMPPPTPMENGEWPPSPLFFNTNARDEGRGVGDIDG